MTFDPNYFTAQQFTLPTLSRYLTAARHSFLIAQKSQDPEVAFHFTCMALARLGIYYIARAGYRVKGKPGHHQKIIEALARILKSQDIEIVGNKMRKDRNLDFYDCETVYDDKEIKEYLIFVEEILKDAEKSGRYDGENPPRKKITS